MKKAIKKLWIKALLSGKYKQGKDYLCIKKGKSVAYCCLGVLYDLHRIKTKKGWWEENFYYMPGRGCISSNIKLPPAVQQWAGIFKAVGEYGDDRSLTNDNDAGLSFKQIAKIIDKHF